MKKILFVGLGSIGQRHLQNAKKIFLNYNFYALRETNHNNIIKNAKLIKKNSLKVTYNLKEVFYKLKDAIKLKPDIVFICNPTAKHLDTCISFAKIKSHLFVEKPVGDNLKKYNILKNLISKNKLITVVGYQTRFHPGIKFIKKIIDNKAYGKVISANFSFLTFLPNHHDYENYKKTYVSVKKLGGGTSLNLSHEIDLIYYFFGMPTKVNSYKINPKIINTETEEDVHSMLIFKDRSIVQLNLSYSSYIEQRFIEIKFKNSFLKFDLITGKIFIFDRNKKFHNTFLCPKNNLFNDELKYFKDLLNGKIRENPLSIEKHQNILKLIKKI